VGRRRQAKKKQHVAAEHALAGRAVAMVVLWLPGLAGIIMGTPIHPPPPLARIELACHLRGGHRRAWLWAEFGT
jgi:hypothetical protein